MMTTKMRAAIAIPIMALLSLVSITWLETFNVAIQQQEQESGDIVKQSSHPPLSIDKIAFVDIRKSGGKDIKYMFPIVCNDNDSNECTQQHVQRDSILAQKITGYMHVKGFQPTSQAIEQADAFLYNLRHPIDRVMAWYQMERPEACASSKEKHNKACSTRMDIAINAFGPASRFYRKCFSTFDLLLEAFHEDTTHKKKKKKDIFNCTELAHQVVEGKVTGPGFQQAPFEFDMQYYVHKTMDQYPEKSILVLRSESLWDDLTTLETRLGGRGKFQSTGEEYHASEIDADFGPLCCQMMEEMRSYRQLLKVAVNIDNASKKKTIKNAVKRCGFASWKEMESTCQQPESTSIVSSSSSSAASLSFSNIMFVDIRKSLGSTMRHNFHVVCELEPKQCKQPAPESALSNQVRGYMHGKGDSPPLDMIRAADAYLFELRHPVDRLLALYHYQDPSYDFSKVRAENHKALFVKKCFHRNENGSLSHECTDVAQTVIQNPNVGRSFKLLDYYANLTINQYPNKSVLAVRAESMWDDLDNLDLQLGGKGKFGDGGSQDDESLDKSDDTADYGSLCCALQEDIRTYRRLIELSVNLDKKSKKATIANALKHCGFSSWDTMANQCEKHLSQAPPSSTDNAAISLFPSSSPVLPYKKIVFVHVGKAGGQTLRILFKAFCESDRKHIPDECAEAPPSMLSDKTSGYIHPREVRPKNSPEKADAFLFNIRHPVDRMISWYHYEHPKSCMKSPETRLACLAKKRARNNPKLNTAKFYKKCFPTQDLLPLAFNRTDSNGLSSECVDLAKTVIEGKLMDRGFKHIYYNYHYYTSLTTDKYPDAHVLVVRIESLWEDFKAIDVNLGGNGNFGKWDGTKDSHGSEKYRKSNTTLSTSDYSLLCCALMDEMNIYRNLLERAVNLDENGKAFTIASTVQRCGFSSWKEMEDHCQTDY